MELGRLDRRHTARHRYLRRLPDVLGDRRVDLRVEARRMMTRIVRTVVGLAAVLLVAGSGYYWRFVREVPVRTVAPQQNVEVRVFGIGTIEAQVVSKVGFQIAGKLVAIEADQGDFVKAGALLAKLD